MSFVTKRERVFKDDVDLYELPPRNECKIKAYASCTDARAWSHFYSDQSEHLVDIIKRNNTSCAPKYVPTKVIVDTIMSQKNCEISRLRRKIDTLDQMLAVYDQLELDCGQKCEIARAHESIKAASKDLDDVCLDLDLSGFTEGFVESSDVYETGKSRGDEMEKSRGDMSVYSRVTSTEPNTDTKAVQKTPAYNDATTVAKDPRIEEMRDEIIFKDAKLNAMQNSMAVMENDVCEPYCVYAHIYTALEKIYGILYQNDTYRQYLELLSAGKDTRCLDIKGRILFKMKVLEKFSLALVAPCSKKFAAEAEKENAECPCGNTKIVGRVETAYALTSAESEPPPTSDSKRSHLVAEIINSDEMKEILEISDGLDDTGNAYCGLTCYSIDAENVKRLKDLQKSYDDLMECYENLKHEKDCLQVRCRKYNELELEVEALRDQLASCNALWSEKERYRKRSSDLEDIHEKYLILQNVTGNLESELKAEKEINNNKMQLVEDLRNENLILERKLSDATIAFEREKSALMCKLKEFECALACKDQEVRSLSDQFQKHFEDSQERERDSIKTFSLINEIESLKAELLNAKGLLNCCEEEKQHMKEEFQDKLSLINDLRMEIEDWRGEYENLLAQNSLMEKQFESDIADLEEKNDKLSEEMDSKTRAMSNLMEMLSEKSKEINTLLEDIENQKKENEQIMAEVLDLRNEHSICIEQLETEKFEIQELLESERKKSKQLEDALHSDNQQDILQNLKIQRTSDAHPLDSDYDSLRALLAELTKENQLIREKINNGECCQVDFKLENERLNNIIRMLQSDKRDCEKSQNLLIEDLNNWKQKFEDLKKENINKTQNLDSMVAELNNWKQKCRQLGGEKYDDASDNYEEAESSPEKQYYSTNANNENLSKTSDRSTSQVGRAEIDGSIWKQRFSESRERTRSSLDSNTLGRVTEHRERISIISADGKTARRLSESSQIPLYNVNDKALRRDSDSHTRARLFSADGKTIPLESEPSASRRHSLTPRGEVRSSTAEERGSYQDSQYRTEEENLLKNFDEKASLIDSELKELSEILKAKETTQNIIDTRDRSKRESFNEKGSPHVSEHRDYADENVIPLDSKLLNQTRAQSFESDRILDTDKRYSRRDSDRKDEMKLSEPKLQDNAVLSSLSKETTQDVLESQEKTRRLSYNENASRRDSEQTRTLSIDERKTRIDSDSQGKIRLMEPELQDSPVLPRFPKETTQDDLVSQERNRRVSYNENVSRRVSQSRDYASEKALRHDSKLQDENFEISDLEHQGQAQISTDERKTRIDSDSQGKISLMEPELQDNPVLPSFPKETTQDDLVSSQERNRRLSYNENVSRRVSQSRDYASEKALRYDSKLQDETFEISDLERQGRAQILSTDERKTRIDSVLPEQIRLLEPELMLSSLDEQAHRRDLEPQKQEQLLNADLQDPKPSQNESEKSLGRDPDPQIRARFLSADGKITSLDFGVKMKGNLLNLDLSVSRHDSEIKEKPGTATIDTKLTSHDLRPLERAKSSVTDEMVMHEDSRYQEKYQTLSSENEEINTNQRSDLEAEGWLYEEQHDSNNEKHRKLERDSDYSSRRPSFGKAEAAESLKKQRHYSNSQYESFDETYQQKSESESRSRHKGHSEEQTDWKQKHDEFGREKVENLLSNLHDQEKELNYWKKKFNDLEKDNHDEQTNIKNKLDEIMQEKKQLEQILRDKNNELDLEKNRNQLYLEKVHEMESIEGELEKTNQLYEHELEDKQKQLDDTNVKMNALLQSLEHEKSQLFTLSERIPDLENKLEEYQNEVENALAERESLQNQLKLKTDELNEKLAENNALNEKLQELRLNQSTSDDNLITLQNEKDQLQRLINAMEKEINKLLKEIDDYKAIAEDLDNIKNDADIKEKENKSLKDKLNKMEMQFTLLEKKYDDELNALAANNNELETLLVEAREEVARGLESPERSFYETLKDELAALKMEKNKNHEELRELKDQQDENENLISELKSELMTRDERMTILENHINLLQDEIKRLHKDLDDGVSASEQLQEQAFEGYDESMKKIEAHHSKAFHNMKMELSQLEKEKAALQEQLSKTRNENEESLRDKNAYLSQIADLMTEREEMLKELKKLELIATGRTGLVTGSDSDIQSVRESFSRISNNLEANRSQSAALESKLHIVKKTSEELFSKTNEAKKIAESEKQKVLLEKEEAVRERLNLEKQMQDLKAMYEKQRDEDAATIEDLKKEILNQILLMKEIKDSTQEREQKLKDELASMENIYKDSQIAMTELQNKLQDSNHANEAYQDTIKAQTDTIKTQNKQLNEAIEKYNEKLMKNHKELFELQEAINDVRSISKSDAQTQEHIQTRENSTQIQKEPITSQNYEDSQNKNQQTDFPDKKSRAQERNQEQHRKASENIPQFAENMTGLQIMNADVQPTLDFVKNTYTKYKQGQLSPGPVEQHSILSLVDNKKDSDNQLIDIHSRQTLPIENAQYDKANNNNLSSDTNTVENIYKNKQKAPSSGKSNDEDLFVIYTNSETEHNELPPFSIPNSSSSNGISKHEENNLTLINKTDLEKGFDDGTNKMYGSDVSRPRGEKVKLQERKSDAKVKISASDEGFGLPKKHKPNVTMIGSISNAGKSSQSSYNYDASLQMLPQSSDTDDDKLKRKETQSKSNLSLNETKLDSEDFFDNLSNDQDDHFKIGRVDAESIIFKEKDKITPETSEKQDLGLNFILETAKHETKDTFDYNTNILRRSQSVESFSKNSSRTAQENSFSANNRPQIVSHSVMVPVEENKVTEKRVSINVEPSDKAAKKIEQLTTALDNSEKDYRKKLEAIKAQYDANIKRIINEHNEGVRNLQSLHEDMVKDLVKKHENEVENLRSISFESMKRAEQMEKENKSLRSRLGYSGNDILEQEPVKIDSRSKVRDARLSKTTIESFDVKPKMRHAGPCTCSLDVNVSDTIRNIFDQVDQDQRKLAEFTYVKYIAHKMLSGNVDALDAQELAFLHYNVCRHWKVKQNIEDTLRKKIDSLETELISKQRHAQQHIAELDRRVAEERRRLQEVREAVGYQPAPGVSHDMQPDRDSSDTGCICTSSPHPPRNIDAPCSPIKVRKIRPEGHGSERRCQKPQQPQNHPDEMPTRLRRCTDRSSRSCRK